MSEKDQGAAGGTAVTSEVVQGTSGGRAGTGGRRRRLAGLLAAGFLLILALVAVADAESMLSDFAAARVPVRPVHVWTWEWTSILAWLSTTPGIWWLISRLRRSRAGWPMIAAIVLAGAPLASAWHIGWMIAARTLVYALMGESYRFEGALAHPYLYEFRKDLGTYAQFTALAALSQWLLARAGDTAPVAEPAPGQAAPRYIEVADGSLVRRVPVEEVDHVAAAGNYVELAVGGTTLLHRATLAGVGEELGPGFVRIHRSRLVRREAVRAIETNQAGDFAVELASGARLRGSRRYRAGLEADAF